MKKALKWAGIIFLIFIVSVMIYAFLGKEETMNLKINSVDLTNISDGEYTGEYNCYRWSNSVIVTVKNHTITNIDAVKGPNGREKIRLDLTKLIIDAQSLDVDAMSGATVDEHAFLKAVENALQGENT